MIPSAKAFTQTAQRRPLPTHALQVLVSTHWSSSHQMLCVESWRMPHSIVSTVSSPLLECSTGKVVPPSLPSLSFACLHVFPVAYSDGGGVDGGSVTPDVRQACTMLGAAWFIAARPHIAKKFQAREEGCERTTLQRYR